MARNLESLMPHDELSTENTNDGAVPTRWFEYRDQLEEVRGEVIEEAQVTIYLNGKELAAMMTTPRDLEALALGFMLNEGLIESAQEVDHIHISMQACCADVWLNHSVDHPRRKIITSGCGGGVTFRDPLSSIRPLSADNKIDPKILFKLFNHLQRPESLYARARGVHTAGLSDGQKVLCMVEDVGRHNTIDKLVGRAEMEGVAIEGNILLVSGRVSSEMLLKAVVMGCPMIASRNSPTSLSITLAEELNITLIGYVRRNSMRVYSHPQRLILKSAGEDKLNET
jgi:FdhD protein